MNFFEEKYGWSENNEPELRADFFHFKLFTTCPPLSEPNTRKMHRINMNFSHRFLMFITHIRRVEIT